MSGWWSVEGIVINITAIEEVEVALGDLIDNKKDQVNK